MSRPTARRALGAGLAALALAVSAAGCGDARGATARGATARGVPLVAKGALTSCADPSAAPFALVRDGRITGFDVALLDLVAARLGVRHRVVRSGFETLKSGAALDAGKCDIVLGAMAVTPARAGAMDATEPYFGVRQALVVRAGSPITSLDGVRAEKPAIGVQENTPGEEWADGEDLHFAVLPDPGAQLDALRAGRVAVIVQNEAVVRQALRDPARKGLAVIAAVDTGERYAFWVRKGRNPRLAGLVDQVLGQARADGTYDRIHAQWIGTRRIGTRLRATGPAPVTSR
ncbi:substrate-binding periplasmic protein [Spirillospora albida]|uniref:substrate-binding periplasmic protein n=1 Tax=Spirillospora albida TaxID=58123 RepID=UPI0012FAC781|nr:ABC transporter substrate-binding protein [Spirillospora albida]